MRVVLVEDHLSFRESFRIALELDGRFQVVGEAATAREACRVVGAARPDLAVVDLMLQDTDGVALVRELRRRRTSVRTLLLAHLRHPLFVSDALRAGALGYALKDEPLADILAAMERVGRGGSYLSPTLGRLLGSEGALEAGGGALLSAREREVLSRLLEGLSAKEIAHVLCVSVRTVHAHRLQINRKLGVHTPAQFARLAATQGMFG